MITSLLRSRKLWKLAISEDYEELGSIQRDGISGVLVNMILFGFLECRFGIVPPMTGWESVPTIQNKCWNPLLDLELLFFYVSIYHLGSR
jgi:hypothetical protein